MVMLEVANPLLLQNNCIILTSEGPMIEYLFRNLFELYSGACVRFLYLRYIKRKDVHFKELLHPIKKVKTKDDEINVFMNEMTNRSYGCLLLMLLVILSLILVRYGII